MLWRSAFSSYRRFSGGLSLEHHVLTVAGSLGGPADPTARPSGQLRSSPGPDVEPPGTPRLLPVPAPAPAAAPSPSLRAAVVPPPPPHGHSRRSAVLLRALAAARPGYHHSNAECSRCKLAACAHLRPRRPSAPSCKTATPEPGPEAHCGIRRRDGRPRIGVAWQR